MLSDFDMVAFPAAPLSEVTSLGPPQANIDADLLLVSQIGGLRRKSAQAEATNAKLNAAIYEARERRELERTQQLQVKRQQLMILSKWLVNPKTTKRMQCCFDAWHSRVAVTIRKRESEEFTLSRLLNGWLIVTITAKQSRDTDITAGVLEAATKQVDVMRHRLLMEQRERRLSKACTEVVYTVAETYAAASASSVHRVKLSSEELECPTILFPMGDTAKQACRFLYEIWKSLVRLRPRRYKKSYEEDDKENFKLKRWDNVLARLMRRNGGNDTDLCEYVMLRWKVSCSEGMTAVGQRKLLAKASAQERVKKALVGDASCNLFATALVAMAVACWKACVASVRFQSQLSSRWRRMHLQFLLSDLLSLWAMAISIIKAEVACVELRVLKRRALNAAFSTTLDSEHSWQAAVMFYRWRCEVVCSSHHRFLQQSGDTMQRHAAARSRMVALLHLSQLEIRMEHLTLAWNTWRQWQSRQNSRKWREQAQESLRLSKVEQDAKASSRIAYLSLARSTLIDTKVMVENSLCLRDAFELLALHARVEKAMRQFQTHVVGSVDAERKKLLLQHGQQRNRILAILLETRSHAIASDCLHAWLHEVQAARIVRWRTRTTKDYLNSLYDSSPWMRLLPIFTSWCSWKMHVCESSQSKYQHQHQQVQCTFGQLLSMRWKESLVQLCFSAWRLACVVYSTHKLVELETQCDELLRLLEAEKCEREKAVAKTLWQQEILTELELASQNEARIRRQQEEAEEAFRREAEELRRLQANVLTMAEEFQYHVEASPHTSGDTILMNRADIHALVSGLRKRFRVHDSQLLNEISSSTYAEAADHRRMMDQKQQDPITSHSYGTIDTHAQLKNDILGGVHLQSPLTATSVWVENVWSSPQTSEKMGRELEALQEENAGGAQEKLPVAQVGQSCDDGENLFIKRCGELTRQQEAFIAKLKAHPEIGLDELRSQCNGERAGINVSAPMSASGKFGSKSWHDISSPLCAVADTPVDYTGTCEELLGASLEKPASLESAARQYVDDVALHHRNGADVFAGTEAVCRRLSFEMQNGHTIPSSTLERVAEDEKMLRQPRHVSFDSADEVVVQATGKVLQELSGGRIADIAYEHHKHVDVPHHSQVEESMSSSFDIQGDGALDDNLPIGVWHWRTWSPGNLPCSADDNFETAQILSAQSDIASPPHQDAREEYQSIDAEVEVESDVCRGFQATEKQLHELRQKLQCFLSEDVQGCSHSESMQSLESRGNHPFEENSREKQLPREEDQEEKVRDFRAGQNRPVQENADCQAQLDELRRTLLHGLPDFSCNNRMIAATEDDSMDEPSYDMEVVVDRNLELAANSNQGTGSNPSTWPSLASSGPITPQHHLFGNARDDKEGPKLPLRRDLQDKQFFGGLSPQSFATRLEGFSFGMSDGLASSTSVGAPRPVMRAASDGQHATATHSQDFFADVFERLHCMTVSSPSKQ